MLRRIALPLAATALLLPASAARAAITFAPPTAFGAVPGVFDVSPEGGAGEGEVAMAASGAAVAVWPYDPPSGAQRILCSVRPAGGVFGPAQSLSDPARYASGPQVAMDAAGNATIAFAQTLGGTASQIRVAALPAGATQAGAPAGVSDAAQDASSPTLAVDSASDAALGWVTEDSPGVANGSLTVRVSSRPARGTWSAAAPVSTAGTDSGSPSVAVGRGGDVTWAWEERDTDLQSGNGGRLATVSRPAGQALGTRVQLTPGGSVTDSDPAVVVDGAGVSTVAYDHLEAGVHSVRVIAFDRAGLFRSTQTLTTRTSAPRFSAPDAAIDLQDRITLAWSQETKLDDQVPVGAAETTAAASGAVFPTATTLDAQAIGNFEEYIARTRVDVDPAGDAIFGWAGYKPGFTTTDDVVARAAVRPAGGPVGPVQDLPSPSGDPGIFTTAAIGSASQATAFFATSVPAGITYAATLPAAPSASPPADTGAATTTAPPVPTTTTPPPTTTATAPVVTSPPAQVPATPQVDALTGLPSPRRCVSRRAFTIHLKPAKGVSVKRARVTLDKKVIATRTGKKITAAISLKGLPKGSFTVTVKLTLTDGRTVTGTRTYKTCATKKKGKR